MKNLFKLFNNSKKQCLKAFTLAEVIFVMGIIGIVGILAVTNARKEVDDAEKIAQLRKTYEILSTAFATAVAENGTTDLWGNDNDFWSKIKPYMKISQDCGTRGCWRKGNTINLSSTNGVDIQGTNYYKGILNNGVAIAISTCNFTCTDRLKNTENDYENFQYAQVYVDVNGAKRGLHKLGDDIFAFRITKNGDVRPYVPTGDNQKNDNVNNTTIAKCRENGIYCTAWAIKFGNIDYLNTNASGVCNNNSSITLNWNGAHSCTKSRQ